MPDLNPNLCPPHGVIYIHGAVLMDYIEFFKRKGLGLRVDCPGQSFQLTWSSKLVGIKFTKSALARLQGEWVYPFSYLQMSKQLITHRYVGGLGQFFEYVGRPAKDVKTDYARDELYEQE